MSQKDSVYFAPEGSPVVPGRFDSRIRRRSLTRGIVTRDELKAHLNNLPDDKAVADFRDYEALVKDESVESSSGSSTGFAH